MPCYTRQKMSDDRMQTNAVINDKLLGTVVAYFRFGGIFNNQVKKCLLLSLPVIFYIGECLAHLQGKGELCR